MNGKRAKALRRATTDRTSYRIAKREHTHSNTGQAPRSVKARATKKASPIPPTWPRTANQLAQSRPVIVIKPVRALRKELHQLPMFGWQRRDLVRNAGAAPKHLLDDASTNPLLIAYR